MSRVVATSSSVVRVTANMVKRGVWFEDSTANMVKRGLGWLVEDYDSTVTTVTENMVKRLEDSYVTADMVKRGLGLFEEDNDSSTWQWTPVFDGNLFYKEYLQGPLADCYKKINSLSYQRKGYLVQISDLVSLATRYPSRFRNNMWEEIIAKKIMVDDPEILPILISSLPPHAHLRQPLQILPFSLPPNGSLLVYCDGCPHHIEGRDGGGGIVTVTGSGVVRVYGVKIAFGSPLVTEARVVLAAIPLALEEVTSAIFVSDNQDLIDGLNGRRFIRPEQQNLFSELWHGMSRLRERYCLHSFRDGLSLSDAIGRQVRAGGYLHSSVPTGHAVEIPEAGLREEHRVLLSRLTRRIPAIKIDCFRADEIQKYSLDELHEKRRWCPEKP